MKPERSIAVSDYEALWANAQTALQLNEPEVRHLASRMAILDYIRIADQVAAQVGQGKILDWGCGYGQVSYLLRSRGLEVTSYDIGLPAFASHLPISRDLRAIVGSDPVFLPFPMHHFDAVLSCGVFEHVVDENGSLNEINRVLRTQGLFLLYNLPNQYSYKEALIENMHLGYTHERKYTFAHMQKLLSTHGFRMSEAHSGGMLPHTLTGIPSRLRIMYDRGAPVWMQMDTTLSRVPLLNRFAEALEIVAVKESESAPPI